MRYASHWQKWAQFDALWEITHTKMSWLWNLSCGCQLKHKCIAHVCIYWVILVVVDTTDMSWGSLERHWRKTLYRDASVAADQEEGREGDGQTTWSTGLVWTSTQQQGSQKTDTDGIMFWSPPTLREDGSRQPTTTTVAGANTALLLLGSLLQLSTVQHVFGTFYLVQSLHAIQSFHVLGRTPNYQSH